MKKFGEKNLDVLQNIEFGIVEVYRADRSLLICASRQFLRFAEPDIHSFWARRLPRT